MRRCGSFPTTAPFNTTTEPAIALVEYICDRVIVLYLGRIMEIAPSERLYAAPKHSYTTARCCRRSPSRTPTGRASARS